MARTMTDDLVAFLRARLDEDEQTARAAADETGIAAWVGSDESGHAWRYQHGGVWGDHDGLCSEAPYVVGTDLRQVQDHIARHDPARVLAEVDAKRRMVDEYAKTVEIMERAGARLSTTAAALNDLPSFTTWARARDEALIMRDWVALLALPFADHPDYRQEWAP